MVSTGTIRFNQTSYFAQPLIWINAAVLVRFIVQSLYHQPKSTTFRLKLFYTVMKIFQLQNYLVKLPVVINRNSFRFILYLHVHSSS